MDVNITLTGKMREYRHKECGTKISEGIDIKNFVDFLDSVGIKHEVETITNVQNLEVMTKFRIYDATMEQIDILFNFNAPKSAKQKERMFAIYGTVYGAVGHGKNSFSKISMVQSICPESKLEEMLDRLMGVNQGVYHSFEAIEIVEGEEQ